MWILTSTLWQFPVQRKNAVVTINLKCWQTPPPGMQLFTVILIDLRISCFSLPFFSFLFLLPMFLIYNIRRLPGNFNTFGLRFLMDFTLIYLPLAKS